MGTIFICPNTVEFIENANLFTALFLLRHHSAWLWKIYQTLEGTWQPSPPSCHPRFLQFAQFCYPFHLSFLRNHLNHPKFLANCSGNYVLDLNRCHNRPLIEFLPSNYLLHTLPTNFCLIVFPNCSFVDLFVLDFAACSNLRRMVLLDLLLFALLIWLLEVQFPR